MNRNTEDTGRGVRWPWAALLALAVGVGVLLLADLSATRGDDRYELTMKLPGWFVAATALGLAVPFLLRRRRRRLSRAADAVPAEAPASPGDAGPTADPAEWIAVRSPREIKLVGVEEISRLEADGRYARIHAASGEHLAQHSLAELERMLDGSRFVRVHRSAIVNVRRIRSLRTDDYRDFELLLDDGTAMRLSRTYRPRLEAALRLRL
jgi:two-component system, LytTR family, response regulator